MKINGIRCTKCNDIIYSRARHDYHPCNCGSVFIDGGFDYIKISGSSWVPVSFEINATKKQLYNSWNTYDEKKVKFSGHYDGNYEVKK